MPRLVSILLILLVVLGPATQAFAQASPIDVAEMIATAAELDGGTVIVEGEAIGEALRAPAGRVWVNVLDGDTAIGVVMDRSDADLIDVYGEWKTSGDRLRVTGVLNEACSEHGGDLDVHAREVVVLSQGSAIDRPVQTWKALVAAFAAAAAALLYRAYDRARRRGGY